MAEFRLANFTSGTALTAAELNTGLTYTDYTPTWTQSATITKTVNFARYTQFGKLVIGTLKMTATSAGTANNKMLISLPVNISSNNDIIGTMRFTNVSETAAYAAIPFIAFYESSTTMSFSPTSGQSPDTANTDARFGQNYTSGGSARTGITVASGDIVYVQFQYEAA